MRGAPAGTGGGIGEATKLRLAVSVRGTVQGVGFRPFVYRLASEIGATGWCVNSGGEVRLEIQASGDALEEFLARLVSDAPPAASVEAVDPFGMPPVRGENGFRILKSEGRPSRPGGLSPDLAPCSACLEEMRDPSSRRFGYALLSCSDCGPRYSVSTGLPYDRTLTTMEPFRLCSDCAREYSDPSDRRFHAEPLACPVCGPALRLVSRGGAVIDGDPVRNAAVILKEGGVLAIKGAGGYLLAVDASDDEAVERVRRFKQRPWKPLAVMVRDIEAARSLIRTDPATEQALLSPAAPIVLGMEMPGNRLSPLVAPGMNTVGLMLPSTPLHHLLMEDFDGALVMTSGNISEDPVISDDGDALRSLDADAFLLHDRRIEGATDDSVIVPPVMVRRSRGFVPRAIGAAFSAPMPIVAAGADQSATFALMLGDRILPGRPIGDMGLRETEEVWSSELDRLLSMYSIERAHVAADLHPGYRSSALAGRLAADRGWDMFLVQHHFAHMCAVLAEHGRDPEETALGLILDGTGYGPDGSIWGCEILEGSLLGYRRAGHLKQVPMPGGEAAVREPRRMAASHLFCAGLPPGWPEMVQVITSKSLSPLTSSAGRLFDAASYILGLSPARVSCQAEAAMRLESATDAGEKGSFPMDVGEDNVIDPSRALEALLDTGLSVPVKAARFHNALSDALCTAAEKAAAGRRIPVVLAGGCWANRILLRRTLEGLEKAGFDVLYGVELPVGDGGVSAGQAAAVAAQSLWNPEHHTDQEVRF